MERSWRAAGCAQFMRRFDVADCLQSGESLTCQSVAITLGMRQSRSAVEDALVALLRTADTVQRRLAEVVEPAGVTLQQYNVLRILRGAGPAGLPTLTVRDRMIEAAPGVTRLIDRLAAAGLVRRDRSSSDRRQVRCQITSNGLELLRKLDDAVASADAATFAGLSQAEQRELVRLLELVQASTGNGPTKPSARGNG